MTTFFSLLAGLAGLVETEGQRDRPTKVIVVVCGLSAQPDAPEFERGPIPPWKIVSEITTI